jgi:anthranilate synthase component II
MKILIIDNYDSFVYNLVQYIEEIIEEEVTVFRNDAISLDEVEAFDTIILSPGPGVPSEAGIMLDLIKRYAPTKKIFGVCLGQQAIGEAFGGDLTNLDFPFHGLETPIQIIDNEEVTFKNMPNAINVGRYHSWVVKRENLPDCFKITAIDAQGNIMGLRHKIFDVSGVQFHPESIMTKYGKEMLRNVLGISF